MLLALLFLSPSSHPYNKVIKENQGSEGKECGGDQKEEPCHQGLSNCPSSNNTHSTRDLACGLCLVPAAATGCSTGQVSCSPLRWHSHQMNGCQYPAVFTRIHQDANDVLVWGITVTATVSLPSLLVFKYSQSMKRTEKELHGQQTEWSWRSCVLNSL